MKLTWIPLRDALPILGYIIAFLGVNLAMKFASLRAGSSGFWWWFIGGNFIGFFCTVFLTRALKFQHPNVVYALCVGGGFCLLQFACYFLFKEPLTFWQWLGIGLVVLGTLCLQIKAD
jgi:multidrug transporter EmrE-like cation transporter